MKKNYDDQGVLDEAKKHLPDYLRSIGLDPSKNMRCLFHSPDNHPSMTLLPDHTAVYCHACQRNATIVDIIMEHEGLNTKDAIIRAIDFAGLTPVTKSEKQKSTPKNAPQTPHKPACASALKSSVAVDYLHQRGFKGDDKDIINKYKIGYDKKNNCLIIPHDGSYYTARAIGNVDKDARYCHNPATSVTLFNGDAINTEPIIAVTEGAIDALSLICCNMPAVATGGAGTQSKLIAALKKVKRPPNIIVAFDSDDAGKKAADKLINKITEEFNSPYARLNLKGATDVNELFCSDREKLQASIRDAIIDLNNFVIPLPIAHSLKRENVSLSIKQVSKKIICNRFGYPAKIAANFDTIFELDPIAHDLVAFNEFSNRIVLTKCPPWRQELQPNTEWQDADDHALQNYIDRTYEFRCTSVFLSVLYEYAFRRPFHPVREFLKSLPQWDHKPRAETLLIDNLGAKDIPYIRTITLKWLLAAVARVYNPGCKFDYCLVLKGKQGIGKSTILQRLGGDFFGELDSIQGKDAVDKLLGLWIVELVEMQATKRADNEQIKSFLSTQKDRARLAYDKRTSEFRRQCVFAATTNENEFLRDQTGGRRFWIAELHAEHYSIRADFEPLQVWAEVCHIYKELFADGFDSSKLDIPNDLRPIATELQVKNTDGSDIRGRIEAFLERPIPMRDLWQLLSQEERRMFFKMGKFRLPFARIENKLPKHELLSTWKKFTKDDLEGNLYLLLSDDIADEEQHAFIFDDDPRRQTISPVELANELFYDDKIAVSNRRIADIMRTIDSWQQSNKQPQDHAYGQQKTVFKRVTSE